MQKGELCWYSTHGHTKYWSDNLKERDYFAQMGG